MSGLFQRPSDDAPHAARPRPSADGKRPSRGTQPCAACGEPVHRVGKFIASDGVRGTWVHVTRKAVACVGHDPADHWCTPNVCKGGAK